MEFNEEKARMLLIKMYEAYRDATHLYEWVHVRNGDAPQHRHIPNGVERGSPEHVIFLFFANLLTYHSESDQGFAQVKKVYEQAPEAFSKQVIERSPGFIQGLLDDVGFIYPNEGGRRWYASAKTLFDEYGGDPLAIFQGRSFAQIMATKKKKKGGSKGFVGLGPKLLSLLVVLYEEIGVIKYIEGAFPVDLHVQAECLGTGIVTVRPGEVNATRLAEFLRPRIAEICRAEGIPVLDLSHAMWFLGNRVCAKWCRKRPRQVEVLCPIYAHCSGRVTTSAYAKRGKWDMKKKRMPLFEGHDDSKGSDVIKTQLIVAAMQAKRTRAATRNTIEAGVRMSASEEEFARCLRLVVSMTFQDAQAGAYAGVCYRVSIKPGKAVAALMLGDLESDEAVRCFDAAKERAERLKANLKNGHISAFQSQDKEKGLDGGAVLAGNEIFAFCGKCDVPQISEDIAMKTALFLRKLSKRDSLKNEQVMSQFKK